MREKNEEKKAIVYGIIVAIGIFLIGFGVLFLFWNSGVYYYPDLKGLFSYYASSYGDAICLPILIGSLIAYVYQAKEIRLSISRTEVFITIIC